MPICWDQYQTHLEFSPHSRGYAISARASAITKSVLPALAGVCLFRVPLSLVGAGSPRTRGGMPFGDQPRNALSQFSPHSRGYAQKEKH